MGGFIVRRLLQAIPVLLCVTIVVFVVLHLSPGDPVMAMYAAQPGVTNDMLQAARAKMGLNQPLYAQYAIWLSGVVRGDLGDSYINHVSVSTVLLQKLPASAELAVTALLLAMLVAIPGGVIAAVKRGTLIDRLLVAFVSSGIAIPGFWLGIMLVLLFAVVLRWLPPSGYVDFQRDPLGNLRFLCLPALTLAILLAAPILRFVRASMLDVLGEEYIRAARSKGLPERVVVFRHALKNALIPTITVLGLQFAGLLGGAILIEWVFGWPGLGWLAVNSISARDYLVVQGTVLFVATVFVLVNLIVDLLYAVVDPRIRYE
jgi:peptide/nickel transport system permease protein